jgi:hypothetical protein
MRHSGLRIVLVPTEHPGLRLFACLMLLAGLAAGCGNSAAPAQTSGGLGFQLPPGGGTTDIQTTKADDDADAATDDDATEPDDTTQEADADGPDATSTDAKATDVKGGDAASTDVKGTDVKGGDTASTDVKGTDVSAVDVKGTDAKVAKCKTDEDGDGYGEGCPAGDDCDDSNPNFFLDNCVDCSKGKLPGCPCTGKSKPCYGGDPATAGVGICKAGQQACVDGFLGECVGEISPGIETCNNLDDDCDGQVDEGVKSSCGTCDMSCVQKAVGQGSDNTFALNSENSSGVGLDPTGSIVIDSSQISLSLKFIWVSNSPDNTVSKIDCKTAKEVGRYKLVFNGVSCGDPSRTSVDLEGNVWVGCRAPGKVTKIMAEKKNCVDKNGNGTIETSQDANNNGQIEANEMVNEDECIVLQTPVLGSYTRGVGVDKDNNVWIGFYDQKYLKHLKSSDGSVMETVNIPCPPYGLVIDQQGVVWVQGAGCGLVSYNPATKAVNKYNPSSFSYGAYGINVDGKGRIWMGGSSGGSGATSYDPKTGQWVLCQGVPSSAGIATSNDGFVYPAHDCGNGGSVGKVDGEKCWQTKGAPGSYLGFAKTGGCPHGVAVDFDGYVWGVNWTGSSVGKIDPNNLGAAPVIRPVGSSPYTYSDMTGYTLNYFTAPKGLFVTTFFAGGGGNPVSATKAKPVWQSIDIQANFKPATKVHLRFRAADTKDQLEAANWIEAGDFTDQAQLPFDLTKVPSAPILGTMLQVELNLITEDKKVSPAVKSVMAKAKLQ